MTNFRANPSWIWISFPLFPFFFHLVQPEESFPCAPPNVTDIPPHYDQWTEIDKFKFGICWEENEDLLKELEAGIEQMEYGHSCEETEPSWEKIRPGIGNTDYYDEFHVEIPIPHNLIVRADPPRSEYPQSARILSKRGFDHVYKLITTKGPVCDTISHKHMPMECKEGKCVCKTFYPGFGNDYTVHFTEFRDRRVVPIPLEYNSETKKCTFPMRGHCKVQPNEQSEGEENNEDKYIIPCAHEEKEQCLIVGNDFPCTRENVMKTLELYNIRAHNAKERYVPFRLHYPIPCKCSMNEPKLKSDKWPEGGLEDEFIYIRDYDEDVEEGGAAFWKGRKWMILFLGALLLILFN